MTEHSPCKDCITLAICKADIITMQNKLNHTHPEEMEANPNLYTAVMMSLYQKCSILRQYLKADPPYSTTEYSPCKVDKFAKEFADMKGIKYLI